MTSMTPSRQTAGQVVPRCEFTQLSKPECHCPACLALMVANRGAAAQRRPAA